MRRPKVDGPIRSTRRQSRRTSFPTTRCSRWPRRAIDQKPTSSRVAIKAMLAAQRPEGSWEGDPVYQGFNTPFRATQFAVMALSTLYPGDTKAKNWDAAYPTANEYPRNKRSATSSAAARSVSGTSRRSPCCARFANVLRTAISLWRVRPRRGPLDTWQIRAHCRYLIKSLGDPTKMVQSSSAYAVRMVLSRRQDAAPAGRKLLAAALVSPDARTRWGAARVFNQHFRDLTDDPRIASRAGEATSMTPFPPCGSKLPAECGAGTTGRWINPRCAAAHLKLSPPG